MHGETVKVWQEILTQHWNC